MSGIPAELRRRVDELVEASGMEGAAARELHDDLSAHVRDALEAGLDPSEVRRRLGSVDDVAPLLRESPRPPTSRPDASSGEPFLSALSADVRHGLRSLSRAPSLTATVVLVLALGIAANAIVFTVMNEILLRPLPVDDQESLIDVWADVEGGNSFAGFGWHDVRAYQEADGPLEQLAAFTGIRVDSGEGPASRPVVAQLVSREYLPMLGVQPTLGTREMGFEEGLGAEPRVVLSHALWTDRFGADPEVLGTTVLLDGRSATVVGVGPEGFRGHFIGFPTDLWLPLGAAAHFLPGFDPDDRSRMPFEMIGRLREGATPEAARAALGTVADRLAAEFPDTHRGHHVGVTPTTGLDHSLRAPVTAFVAILAGVSALVLLIACLNVGSMLLVRTMSRSRELAVRTALGAGRGRLVRQVLTESSILALFGTALGIGGALLLNGLLSDFFGALSAGLGLELRLDRRVLASTALAGIAAAVLAGATPALHVLRSPPASALRARAERPAASRVRAALVVGQVTVSVVLVVATGLFVRAFVAGARADPGFVADRVATFSLGRRAAPGGRAAVAARSASEGDPGTVAGLEALLAELGALPGVAGVSVADGPPVGVVRSPARLEVPGLEPPPGQDAWTVDARRVGADYLRTVGISLRGGRDLTEADARDGPPVAVVSDAFVRRFWPDGTALGRSLRVGGESVRVVGIAEDARYLAQDDTPDPLMYLSLAGAAPTVPVVTFRAAEPEGLAAEVASVVARWVPGEPPPDIRSARSVLDDALLPQRLGASLVGVMGLAALLLAVVGLYGLVRYSVARHTPELAVRVALGGSGRDVLLVVLRRGFTLAAVGMALGAVAALLLTPALEGFLGQVGARDPAVYAVSLAAFAVVSFVASWLPARRASAIEPARALREG